MTSKLRVKLLQVSKKYPNEIVDLMADTLDLIDDYSVSLEDLQDDEFIDYAIDTMIDKYDYALSYGGVDLEDLEDDETDPEKYGFDIAKIDFKKSNRRYYVTL